uniref:SUZ domain-containing protein 1-like isoform X1 n=1 Tax=Styela clava TaxID=7725 RepID=UPI00193938D0|nr:SUZ domain-containing protein 1-like isoform X1 [Styela clava]
MAEEDIWDSWEDFADSNDLDKHVDQHLQLTNGNSHKEENGSKFSDDDQDFSDDFICTGENNVNNGTQFRILPRPVVHEEDQHRTSYKPQVKILKRPGKDLQDDDKKAKDKLKSQPARSLAERQAAYAEARNRIMGHGVTQGDSNATVSNSASSSKSRSEHRKSKSKKSDSPKTKSAQVERLPKGPDKTGRGFTTPR